MDEPTIRQLAARARQDFSQELATACVQLEETVRSRVAAGESADVQKLVAEFSKSLLPV